MARSLENGLHMQLFLCGDVMTGRGIDQVLPVPCDPVLHEGYCKSARDYIRLAEQAHGPIPRPAAPAYIWGVALNELDRASPDVRIVNLETAITRSNDYVPKGINYRMSPENASCLVVGGVDCCVLANNHVLDWGHAGLLDTLAVLDRLQIKTAGAGHDLAEASAPAVLETGKRGRVLVFALAAPTAGTPPSWAATGNRAGVNFLPDLTPTSASRVADHIVKMKRPRDVVVASIHWGPNWGDDIPDAQRQFAHALIDEADVSIVHGHSSHHAKAIEVYRNRLLLYGCGDFLNDYEGIRGYEEFRSDLRLMYFAGVNPANGELSALEIAPLRAHRFSLAYPSRTDVEWVAEVLNRNSRRFGTGVRQASGWRLSLS
ncbi:poly-gamma-glutamate synthesis protein (capsule biosynthesis protein) [Sinorhizobium terangae]|uniref:Poly-gamma-glutamate biosynthesis protein n=1 Tax=Sinorhizobium terangae TaxID=110322 RepID=A0A6N7LH05_SINTE|nr:CapA family protein [Sinorhizobium terangae]MBB4187181.1 poly-gamma-glutamate synthesis protein (capsule biosynthesis protein) [Sinorhizobium terangae]MQX16580.1 poly-gamma-glutamate biosynthesis protein [Sinorhizobium terangae]